MLKNIQKFDYFVIGGGSGGLASAKHASNLNKKVGLADFVQPSLQGTKWGLGGTCVNVGCIPKKLLHHAAILGKLKQEQQKLGWEINENCFQWEKAISNINIYRSQLMKNKVQYFNAMASFENSNTLKLVDKNNQISFIQADKILIAVGGRPKYLQIEGCQENCISSDDIFWMKKNPGKTLVIGASYIALETAGFLKAFGNETDVLYRSKVLRKFDNDAQRIKQFMKKEGVNFIKGNPIKFIKKNGKIQVQIQQIENQEILTNNYDTVMMAIGRDPLIKNLNLEKIGIEIDKKNKIKVNEKWQTSQPNIHAIGDVISNSLELTPVAIQEGQYLSEGLFTNNWKKLNYKSVPTTLFTPLEYSYCGLTEEQAINKHKENNIEIYHTHFTPLESVLSKYIGDNICYVKVIVCKENRVVLGIHYFGPNAGEVMQGFALAVHLNCKYEDLNSLVGIHPTTAEEVVNLQFTKKENPQAKKEGC